MRSRAGPGRGRTGHRYRVAGRNRLWRRMAATLVRNRIARATSVSRGWTSYRTTSGISGRRGGGRTHGLCDGAPGRQPVTDPRPRQVAGDPAADTNPGSSTAGRAGGPRLWLSLSLSLNRAGSAGASCRSRWAGRGRAAADPYWPRDADARRVLFCLREFRSHAGPFMLVERPPRPTASAATGRLSWNDTKPGRLPSLQLDRRGPFREMENRFSGAADAVFRM